MRTFLACALGDEDLGWLQSSLSSMGQVLRSGNGLDELMGLIDATNSTLVFVGMDRENLSVQCALIESLLEARPMMTVMVVGDGFDNELVLAAMRSGARDFLTYGLRASEVLGLVRRVSERLPPLPPRREQGQLSLLFGNQADPDAAFIAAHLALLSQRAGKRTLFVDLGLPGGEGLELLGIESRFDYSDAVRNLRRIDRSLIDSAFAEHDSGLRVLPAAADDPRIDFFSASELFLLTASLRQNFDHVLINLTGQRDSEMLRGFMGQADKLCWYVDPSVSCCRRNLDLLHKWRVEGVKTDHGVLLVDRAFKSVAPSAAALARTFEMPLLSALPASSEQRLKARNQRTTLFELANRDALTSALSRAAVELGAGNDDGGRKSFWRRLSGAAR